MASSVFFFSPRNLYTTPLSITTVQKTHNVCKGERRENMKNALITTLILEAVAFFMMWSATVMPVLMDYNVGLVGLCLAFAGVAIIPASVIEYFNIRK